MSYVLYFKRTDGERFEYDVVAKDHIEANEIGRQIAERQDLEFLYAKQI